MLTTAEAQPTTAPASDPIVPAGVCPLDGAQARRCTDGYYVCTRCCEMLSASELVSTATPETWAAYLATGETDTDPHDAPLARVTPAQGR